MLCKGVLALVVFVLVVLGGMLGLSFVAIEATKESHVKSDGLMVGTSGQIVQTDIAESDYPFWGLAALEPETLGRIHTVNVAIELPDTGPATLVAKVATVLKVSDDTVRMYTAAGHVLTINGANKTASVRMDGLDLAVLTEEDGRRRLKDKNNGIVGFPSADLPEGARARAKDLRRHAG
mmetsp:Transcript_12731/g.37543  ORF Transcript_12731/g.37543 Transcript_12731/m.37543 type:complete len:179 (+) Transcript_12731:153-689(+)